MRKMAVLAVLLAMALFAAPAFASVTIDFSTGNSGVGGLFTLIGSNATGVNIPIGTMTVAGAPTGNGGYVVTGTCQPAAGQTGVTTNDGCLNFDTRSGTNFISITGTVTGLAGATGTLLS